MRILAAVVVLAVGGLGGWVYASYQRDIRAAWTRVSSGSEIAQTPCGPIEYALDGEGPALLVVHGAGGGYDQAADMVAPLVQSGFRVVRMSRFGYLRTPLPADASAQAQADAHACLLDALKIGRAAILGASAGAPSALQFALRHPRRCSALILLVPAAYVPRAGGEAAVKPAPGTELLFDTALRSDFLFWAAIRTAHDTVLRAILATPPEVLERASAAERARVLAMMERILPVSPRRLGLLNDAAVTSSIERYELERIGAPTLALSAEDDLFGTYDVARYSAAHIPNARFVGYPTGGHVWVGHHEAAMAEIVAFVRENPPIQ
jgi:2-hydroxy-6-oxonona-2,4-dienedioate hydrolase